MKDVQARLRKKMAEMNKRESPEDRAARLWPEKVALCSGVLRQVAWARARCPEANNHPIITNIERGLKVGSFWSAAAQLESYVLTFGRPFFGNPRSPKLKKGPPMERLMTCAEYASAGHGTYVEGIAMHPGVPALVHHAWLTSDGVDAIEVGWERPAECNAYFGIMVPYPVLAQCMQATGLYGVFHGHLHPMMPDALATYLAEGDAKAELS